MSCSRLRIPVVFRAWVFSPVVLPVCRAWASCGHACPSLPPLPPPRRKSPPPQAQTLPQLPRLRSLHPLIRAPPSPRRREAPLQVQAPRQNRYRAAQQFLLARTPLPPLRPRPVRQRRLPVFPCNRRRRLARPYGLRQAQGLLLHLSRPPRALDRRLPCAPRRYPARTENSNVVGLRLYRCLSLS